MIPVKVNTNFDISHTVSVYASMVYEPVKYPKSAPAEYAAKQVVKVCISFFMSIFPFLCVAVGACDRMPCRITESVLLSSLCVVLYVVEHDRFALHIDRR